MSYKRKGNFNLGTFTSRENRFVVWIDDDTTQLRCHLPNPGRMTLLLVPDETTLIYIPVEPASNRKTDGTVIGILQSNGNVINLDTMMFNPLLTEAINTNTLPMFQNWKIRKSEHTVDNHRFDFLLDVDGIKTVTEVKSTTRVVNSVACFPDAVSKRAQEHVKSLLELNKSGKHTMLLFVVYRQASSFRPCDNIDPEFAEVFKTALDHIEIHALQIKGTMIGNNTIEFRITGKIPVTT